MRKKALERRIARILLYATKLHKGGVVGRNQTLEDYLTELERGLRADYAKMHINPPRLGQEVNS